MSQRPEITDPRALANFNPAWLPLCDGGEPPLADTSQPAMRRVIEFAAHYYAMNRAVALVEAARSVGDPSAELRAQKGLRSASRARDALEDRYAPEGFLAEPVMDGPRYVNLVFTWAGKQAPPILTTRFEAEFTL